MASSATPSAHKPGATAGAVPKCRPRASKRKRQAAPTAPPKAAVARSAVPQANRRRNGHPTALPVDDTQAATAPDGSERDNVIDINSRRRT